MKYGPSITKAVAANENEYSDFRLVFGPVSERNGEVRFIDYDRRDERLIGLALYDEPFTYRVQADFPSIVADLADVGVAIQASDRLARQHLRRKQRRLHVVLPVRHPEVMASERICSKLEDLLYWTTGSTWVFEFEKRKAPGRLVEQQSVIPVATTETEVALWSGGLDALAGLYTLLCLDPTRLFVLFGTGSNDGDYARQKKVADALQSNFQGRTHLYRVPIRFFESGSEHKNSLARARGVAFTLLGAACAYLVGQRRLCVYENGVAAINLPYRASGVGLDHNRSVHPLTLLRVSDFVSAVLGEDFVVQNPFLFWTKAQMCEAMDAKEATDLPSLTMSCDGPHRQQPVQCGYCSSCLLRRQALAAAQVEDLTRYVVPHGVEPQRDPTLHFRAMLAQVDTFRSILNISERPDLRWEALSREFPILDDVVDRTAILEKLSAAEMHSQLVQLYQNYVSEWDAVRDQLAGCLVSDKGSLLVSESSPVVSHQG